MSQTTLSKKDRLLTALRAGKKLTAAQIAARYGFASPNSVTGTITHLRDAGYNIVGSLNKSGRTQYSLSNNTFYRY